MILCDFMRNAVVMRGRSLLLNDRLGTSTCDDRVADTGRLVAFVLFFFFFFFGPFLEIFMYITNRFKLAVRRWWLGYLLFRCSKDTTANDKESLLFFLSPLYNLVGSLAHGRAGHVGPTHTVQLKDWRHPRK